MYEWRQTSSPSVFFQLKFFARARLSSFPPPTKPVRPTDYAPTTFPSFPISLFLLPPTILSSAAFFCVVQFLPPFFVFGVRLLFTLPRAPFPQPFPNPLFVSLRTNVLRRPTSLLFPCFRHDHAVCFFFDPLERASLLDYLPRAAPGPSTSLHIRFPPHLRDCDRQAT